MANEEGLMLSPYAAAQPVQNLHVQHQLGTTIDIKRVHQEEGGQ